MPAPEWMVEHGPRIAKIIAVGSHGIRDGNSIDGTRYDVSSLRTGADPLLRHVRQR
jgi:hypothetical protein